MVEIFQTAHASQNEGLWHIVSDNQSPRRIGRFIDSICGTASYSYNAHEKGHVPAPIVMRLDSSRTICAKCVAKAYLLKIITISETPLELVDGDIEI